MEVNENQAASKKDIGKIKLRHRRSLRVFGSIVLGIIILGLVGFGAYHYEHNKLSKVQLQLTKTNQSNNTLKSEAVALNKRVASLTSQLKTEKTELNNQTTAQTQTQTQTTPVITDNLNINVLDAYKYYTTKYPNNPYIIVDVTLTNTGATSLTVPLSSFELVDSSGDNGVDFGDLVGTTMPNGKAILGDQILTAGQSVTGALSFSAFNAGYSLYTLNYKDQSFSIDASTSVNQ